MRFQNPAALWLLLGVPILIIIWLIRPQHENRRVSSSYIWKLSDRFMKKRLPFTNFTRWLVFLLQLIVIAGGAFLAARPVINHGNRIDYLVILDSSASMRTKTDNGRTRYETAVEQIKKLAKETSDGHTMSIIAAGDEAVSLVSGATSRKEIASALDDHSCGWGGSALPEALTLAQLFIYEHPSAEVTLYTDQIAAEYDGINIVCLADGAWNASLSDLSVSSDGGGGCMISASLTSWGKDETISVGLCINDKLIHAENYKCASGVPNTVSFGISDMRGITSIELFIEPDDALDADNSIVYYIDNTQQCDAALITETPLYLSSALDAVGRGSADVYSPAEAYTSLQSNIYDMYVFESCAPDDYPVIGTIILINPPSMPNGLTYAGTSGEAGNLIASAAGSGYQKKLLADMSLNGISVSKHSVINASDDWTTVCSVGEDPVLLTRSNGIGQTTVVLAFDLHDSNLPLKSDFVSLIRNMINLAVPPLADRRIVTVGDTLTVTVPQTAHHLSVISPDGTTTVLDYENDADYKAVTAGSHKIICDEYETGFFAVIPSEEGHTQTVDSLTLSHDISENITETDEATSGLWKTIAAVILFVLLAEWGIYIYEQY